MVVPPLRIRRRVGGGEEALSLPPQGAAVPPPILGEGGTAGRGLFLDWTGPGVGWNEAGGEQARLLPADRGSPPFPVPVPPSLSGVGFSLALAAVSQDRRRQVP